MMSSLTIRVIISFHIIVPILDQLVRKKKIVTLKQTDTISSFTTNNSTLKIRKGSRDSSGIICLIQPLIHML